MATFTTEQVVAAAVAAAKDQIRADVRREAVPSTVTSFAALHDFVDANEYGGADLIYALCGDSATDVLNAVQTSVDEWLRGGGLVEAEERRSE